MMLDHHYRITMNIFRKIFTASTALYLSLFSSLSPVSAADNNDYHEIDAGDITPGVMVYENECDEKAAILDEAVLDGTIVLYNVGNELITLDVTPEEDIASPYVYGPWSQGTIPNGTSTLTPHYSNGFVTASFQATVQKSPAMIRNVYNPGITGVLVTVNSSNLSIVRGSASTGSAAIASLTFVGSVTQDGYTAVPGSWYLTLELDQAGHTRIGWNY